MEPTQEIKRNCATLQQNQYRVPSSALCTIMASRKGRLVLRLEVSNTQSTDPKPSMALGLTRPSAHIPCNPQLAGHPNTLGPCRTHLPMYTTTPPMAQTLVLSRSKEFRCYISEHQRKLRGTQGTLLFPQFPLSHIPPVVPVSITSRPLWKPLETTSLETTLASLMLKNGFGVIHCLCSAHDWPGDQSHQGGAADPWGCSTVPPLLASSAFPTVSA